jgi:hypothetical protein
MEAKSSSGILDAEQTKKISNDGVGGCHDRRKQRHETKVKSRPRRAFDARPY